MGGEWRAVLVAFGFLTMAAPAQGISRKASWDTQALKLQAKGAVKTLDQAFDRWEKLIGVMDGSLSVYGVDLKKIKTLGEMRPAEGNAGCPVAYAKPLLWLAPFTASKAAPYRRTLLCVVDLNHSFGGWADLAPFERKKTNVIARYLVSRGGAVLGDPEEEWDLPTHGRRGPVGALQRVQRPIEGQKGHVMVWLHDDLAFIALQWSDEGNKQEDLGILDKMKAAITPDEMKTANLFGVSTLEKALQTAQNTDVNNASRFRALALAKRFRAKLLRIKRFQEYFRTLFEIGDVRLVLPVGLSDFKDRHLKKLAKQGKLLGAFPAIEAKSGQEGVLKIAKIGKDQAHTLPLSGRGRRNPTIAEIGKAILTGYGAEVIDESTAAFLNHPAYEATFLSGFSKAYGRVWVFQRDDDLVLAVLLSKNPREVGRNSEGAGLVKLLEF